MGWSICRLSQVCRYRLELEWGGAPVGFPRVCRYHLELEWGGTPVGFPRVCTYHLELEWSTTSCNVCHLIFRSDLHLIFLESGILSALTVRVGEKK